MKLKPIFHKRFQKFIKKITETELKTKIKTEVDKIIQSPEQGKNLEHPFRKYKIQSHKFTFKGIDYRIAYTQNSQHLIFLVIDSRENFYKKLKSTL